MKELENILAAYDEWKAGGINCILVTLVHVKGSSYRQAGARMLISETGMMTGSISGGCLEGDALKKALFALHQGQNRLITYDTSDDEDAIVGAQLGCNGIIQVLFEPIFYNNTLNPVELLRKVVQHAQSMAIVTQFNLQKNSEQTGTTMIFDAALEMTGTTSNAPFVAALTMDIRRAFELENSQFIAMEASGESRHVFIQYYVPPPELVLVGAGNDAQVLSQMALLLGWKVTIADGRPTHANAQRFGSSCQIIVAKPEKLLEQFSITSRTFFALMTHNFPYDLAVLKLLLSYPQIPYIGILGPRKKFERMLEELISDGIQMTTEQQERVFAPIGLHLGAENAAEIGLSVLAEMLAILNQRPGGHLRDWVGAIHDKRNHEFRIKAVPIT